MPVISWFRKRTSQAAEKNVVYQEQLWAEKLRQKTLEPVAPPEFANNELKRFYAETEWLQPVLNRSLGGGGFRFHELDTPYVSLGTFDEPDFGRTFEVSYGAAVIGQVAVVPGIFDVPEVWADLRVRLVYPSELIEGDEIHDFLTGLIQLTKRYETETYEAKRDDPRASAMASKAMVEALWTQAANPSDAKVIKLSAEGPWQSFKETVEHWKKKNIDPWEKWECKNDN